MTVETLARRLALSLSLSGLLLWVAAVVTWVSSGDGAPVVAHTVHHVVGWVFAVFGVVLIGIALALSAREPDTGRR